MTKIVSVHIPPPPEDGVLSGRTRCGLTSLYGSPNFVRVRPHQQHALGDLKPDSGEVIRDFTISFVTHGTLNAIRDARVVTINPQTVTGHASAGGVFPAAVDALNADITTLLDLGRSAGRSFTRGARGSWPQARQARA